MKRGYRWDEISYLFPPSWNFEIAFRKTVEACKRLGLIKGPKNENRTTKQPEIHRDLL
jgi:hypothetical protein